MVDQPGLLVYIFAQVYLLEGVEEACLRSKQQKSYLWTNPKPKIHRQICSSLPNLRHQVKMVATGKRWQAEVTSKHIIFVPRKISWTYLSKIFQQFYAAHMSILTGKVKLRNDLFLLAFWQSLNGVLFQQPWFWFHILDRFYLFCLFVLSLECCDERQAGKGVKTLGFISSEGFWGSTSKAEYCICQLCPKNLNGALSDSSYSYIEGVPKKRNNSIFQLWTLFWSLFDLLMTLKPYKHLPKFCFMF